MIKFYSVALALAAASLSFTASATNPVHDISSLKARSNSRTALRSDRQNRIAEITEKMYRADGQRRAGAVEADKYTPRTIGPTSTWGDIDGPSGQLWFYTLDIVSDAIEHEYYTEYVSRHWTLNIFDEHMQPVATLADDVHYTEGELRTVLLEPLPMLTNHYFNQDDKYEVAMSFGINFTPGHNHYRTLIYQIDGTKDEKGNDTPLYELDELIADVVTGTAANGETEYYMTVMHNNAYIPEEFDWDSISESEKFWKEVCAQNVVFDVLKKTESMERPQLILSKPVNYAQFPGTQENSPLISKTDNGKAYMIFSYYKEPFFDPYYSWTEDFTQREENSLVIDVYELNDTATLIQTTEIPFAKNDEELLAKYYSIGDLRYSRDINFHDFDTDGKAAFYVTEARQKRGTESPDYFVYYIYDDKGNQLKKVFEGAESHLALADLDGFEPQELFVTSEYGEYMFNFVDLVSCKTTASFSYLLELDEDSDPDGMTVNMDRVKVGNSYQYVDELRMPIDVDNYTWLRIVWLDNKGGYDHTDYVNMGLNVHYAMCYIDESVLNPNLYHSDDNPEYMMLIKRGIWNEDETEEERVEELLVAQAISEEYPDGRDILKVTGNEFGPISNILPYTYTENPALTISFYNREQNKYYCESYALPLDKVSGITAPSVAQNGVSFDGNKVSADGRIDIYNIHGIRVANGNGKVNTANLPAGLYIVKTAQGATKIRK